MGEYESMRAAYEEETERLRREERQRERRCEEAQEEKRMDYGRLTSPCYVYGRLADEKSPRWHLLLPTEHGAETVDGREVTEINGCCIVPVVHATITGLHIKRAHHDAPRIEGTVGGRIALKEDA